MRKANIGIDLDGVVCNINKHINRLLKEMYNIEPVEKMTTYTLEKQYGLSTKQVTDLFMKMGIDGGYRNAEVYPHARQALVRLSRQYSIFYVTVRDFYPQIKKDTFYWLDKNKLPYFRIIFTRSKHKIASLENFQFFLDDCPNICNRVAKTNVPTYMFKQPWNEDDGTDSLVKVITDWREVEKILLV